MLRRLRTVRCPHKPNTESKMNKIAILTLTAAAPLLAGTPEVITPAPAPAPEPMPCTMEIGAVYNMAGRDLFKHSSGSMKEIDTYGMDATLVKPLCEKNAFTLRLGYTFGDEVNKGYLPEARQETDVHTFSLMPGLRHTYELTERTNLFMGANVGVVNESVKDHWRGDFGVASSHDSAWGMGFSAEMGVRYKVGQSSDLYVAYRFSGNTARPSVETAGSTHRQIYNGVTAGMSFNF